MPKVTYQALLDGVTDSCALTEPAASIAPEVLQPPRRPAPTNSNQEVEQPDTQTTGSVTGSAPQALDNLVVSGNQITGTVTIDLTPYQKALDNLDFSTKEDNAFSSTVTSTKFRPSLDSHLGIDGSGNTTYLGDVEGNILVNSDRVILNSKTQHSMMFGQKGVAIGSPKRVNIDAGDSITLAAQGSDGGGLFIGLPNAGLKYTSKKQSQLGLSKGDPTPDQPYEPLVLGIKLANILEDFLVVLKDIQGVDAWSPVKFQPTTQAEFALLANRIPEILSSYAYIDGMSHGAVDMDQLATIKEGQAKAQDYIPPKNLTGSFSGQFTVSNTGAGGGDYSGPGYDPLKKLIFSGESSNYDAMYPSTTYQKKFGVTSMSQTIAKVAATATGAIGRYQNMPAYILNRAKTAGLDPNTALYNEANQEKMGEGLIGSACGPYIKGSNGGSKEDLLTAVQGLGRMWSSLPVVKNEKGAIVGDLETGAGSYMYSGQPTAGGYYTNSQNAYGVIKSKTVKEVVTTLMKARKNISSSKPSFIPSYVNWDTV